MNWFDKFLMKWAAAKAAARWGVSPLSSTQALIAAFHAINAAKCEQKATAP